MLGIDGIINVYDGQLKTLTSLNFGANIMESIESITFNNTHIIAFSGVDTQIHLYEFIIGASELKYLTSLKGHVRSVNALAF